MPRRLPPLNQLRAFEAAARLLSLSKAAAELSVTPAAISHQVKDLERRLGQALFERRNRAVRLTEAGQTLLPALSEGLDRIAAGVAALAEQARPNVIAITCAPSFAGKWLVPRLERFRARHGDIDVRVSASIGMVDLARDGFDLGVRFGHGRYPGLFVERLMGDEIAPVCAPALLKGAHPLRRPEDLRHHTLLHNDGMSIFAASSDWAMWLKAQGVSGVDATRGLRFDQPTLVLDAAIRGHGVALARTALVAEDIAAGLLVRPFKGRGRISDDLAYYFVCPPGRETSPKIAAFRAWLAEEIART